MKSYIAVFFAFSLLFFFSCNKNKVVRLAEDYNVIAKILPSEDESSCFVLHFETVNEYPNICHTINFTKRQSNSGLCIRLKDVENGEGECGAAMGPATADVEIECMDNGTYDLSIENKDQILHGTYSISDDSIQVFAPYSEQTKFVTTVLER